MRNVKLRALIFAVAGLGLVSSCTKQRPEIAAQGQNLEDLVAVSELHNKTCTLTTAKSDKSNALQTKAYSGSMTKPQVDENQFNIKFLDIVEIAKSDCPSVMTSQESLEFRGEPGKTYNMIYRVSANYLTLYKVVSKKDVSHYEIPYSEIHNGTYYVPVAGFDIKGFYTIDKIKNADNRDTNQKSKFALDRKHYSKATHFSIDRLAMKKFEVADKRDVLPREFFQGEWYYNRTRVKAKHSSQATIGTHEASDTNAGASSRVKFHIQKDQLFALNVNIDEKLLEQGDDSNINFEETVKIPIVSVDYRRKREGEVLAFEEEKLKDLKVNDIKYLELEFEDTATAKGSTNLIDSIFSAVEKFDESKQILEFEIGDDFFTYLIEDGANQEQVRYSFKRVPKVTTYEARNYFIEDWDKFGFFKTVKAQIQDHRTARSEDFNKRIMLTRFNPKKPIVFHFSRLTPRGPENEWIRDIARESINFWQQAFEKASGEKRTFITLQETCEAPHPEYGCDVALGDIRYNIINLIDVSQGGLLGFGPSLYDTLTGEIIAATMNTTLFDTREIQYRRLRDFVAEELGVLSNFSNPMSDNKIDPKVFALLATLDNNLYQIERGKVRPLEFFQWNDPSQQQSFSLGPLVDEKLFEQNHGNYDFSNIGSFDVLAKELSRTELHANDFAFTQNHMAANTANFSTPGPVYKEFVAEHCPTVSTFVQQYQSAPSLPSTEVENEALAPCVRNLLSVELLATVTHEIGHNIGLRHNFQGSVDQANYAKEGSFEYKYTKPFKSFMKSKLSSIMDYESAHHTRTVHPGLYDIAAIRYGYFDKIEVQKGQSYVVAELPKKTPIDTYLAKIQGKTKPYMYCTDEHRINWTASTCDYSDLGTNQLDIAKETIRTMYGSLNTSFFRYDRMGSSTFTMLGPLIKLKRIYEDWRALVSQEVGAANKYLPGITVNNYQNVVARVLKRHGKKAEDLLKARNLIFNSLIDLAFTPNRYCVVKSDTYFRNFFYEVSKIREDLINDGFRGELRSCSDQVVQQYFAEKGLSLDEQVQEIGHDIFGGSFKLDPADLYKSMDFGGTADLRLNSIVTLLGRMALSRQAIDTNFAPNFMDEPDFREAFAALLGNRILGGAFVSEQKLDMDTNVDLKLVEVPQFLERFKNNSGMPNFKAELNLVTAKYALFMNSLTVPNDPQETQRRQTPMIVQTTNNLEMVGRPADAYQIGASTWAWVPVKNGLGSAMMTVLRNHDLRQSTAGLGAQAILDGLATIEKAINESPEKTVALHSFFQQFAQTNQNLMSLQQGQKEIPQELLASFAAQYNLLTFVFPPALGIAQQDFNAILGAYMEAQGDPSKLTPELQQLLSNSIPKEKVIELLQHTKSDAKAYEVRQNLFSNELQAQRSLIFELFSIF